MVNGERDKPPADQIILKTKFSGSFFRFSQMATLFIIGIMFYAAYVHLLRGSYQRGVILILIVLLLVLMALRGTLTKEFLFYQDRVVQVWYLFGKRTIYYSRAQVEGPFFPWPAKGYQIKEIKEEGKVPLRQIAISFGIRSMPPETIENIEAIFDYLTEDTKNNLRRCKKVTLPREVICHDSQGHLNPPANPSDTTNAEASTGIPRISGKPFG